MFSKLASLAKKAPPKPPAGAQRRDREDEQQAEQQRKQRQAEEQQRLLAENKKNDDNGSDADRFNSSDEEDSDDENSSSRKISAEEQEKKERELLSKLPKIIGILEQKMQVADKLAKESAADAENSSNNNSGVDEQEGDQAAKKKLACDRADDVVRIWCLLHLTRWRQEAVTRQRQTDPDDVKAMTASIEAVRAYELAMREVTPLLEGLKNHTLPEEMSAALYKAYCACSSKKFLDAENVYFQALLGNSNWHLGLSQALHVRAAHAVFQRENVKSMLNNAEVRKMFVVFKELMGQDQAVHEQQMRSQHQQQQQQQQQQH